MHDNVKIPVVSKTKAKTNTSRKQDRQKETVHILLDVTVPANRSIMVPAYAKLPPRDFTTNKIRMNNGLFLADGLIRVEDEASCFGSNSDYKCS